MSKSRQTITELGASASRSESAKKVLDTERRFIDDLMTREVLNRMKNEKGQMRNGKCHEAEGTTIADATP